MSTSVAIGDDRFNQLEEVELENVKLDPAWSRILPAAGARRYRVSTLCEVDGQVVAVTSNRRVDSVTRFVAKHIRQPFRLIRADDASMKRLFAQIYANPIRTADRKIDSDTGPVVSVCDEIINAACLRGASDIHLIPGDNFLQCSFRVDGELTSYRRLGSDLQSALASRIKVLAGLNIAEKRETQDGRFTLDATSQRPKIDVRVATIPTRLGERLTLRLLAPLSRTPSLTNLGMNRTDREHFSRAIQRHDGMILLTGPTGCGKSTTLYTAIMEMMKARNGNVITIEDPVEYEIPGTTQVEVDAAAKVTFARALRSVLRHDPDVIMLGEIRDAETAELAIKASLTGHLVFSTLHTNSAAGVVTRLIDMGVEPFLVAATLRMAIAQRLVRRLCHHCRQPDQMSKSEAAGLGDPSLAGCETFKPGGCVYCAGQGFVGRTALFEMMRGGAEISGLIAEGAGESSLLDHMRTSQSKMLIDDGIEKITSGTTTAEQVLGVVSTW